MTPFIFVLIFNFFTPAAGYLGEPRKKCVEITVPMCRGIGYNMTSFPNQFNHQTQEEAGLEAHQFWPLVEINCSPDLKFFLCSVYTPICLPDYQKPLSACRAVCERAKSGCAPLMRQYGFEWPANLDCTNLPVFGQSEELCMDSNQTTDSKNGAGPSTTPSPKIMVNSKIHKPSKHPPDEPTLTIKTSGRKPSIDVPTFGDRCQCSCTKSFKQVPNEAGSTMMIYNVSHCTYPCQAPHFGPDNQNFLIFWIGLWSSLCCLSTFLTVITFMIDMQRFKYPERPIIFLSFCYFMVSLGYLIRLIGGHEFVACDGDAVRSGTTGPTQCTVVFLLVYFFGMASSVWWVVLAFTWFLAAGLKWSNEAIASYAQYFHIFAWAVPSIMSVIILALSGVDGDPYSGICYVGNTDVNMLRIFVLGPLFACLVLGSFFLLSGFVSLVRIHHIVKQQQGVSRIEKLAKLMVRIGIFSVMYTIPATIVIACYFYEQHYRQYWEASEVCSSSCNIGQIKPAFSIFVVKYFMCLVVGITSGIWIWSRKTIESWKIFLHNFCCCQSRPSYMPTEAIIIKSHTDISSGCYSRQYPLNHV